MTTFKPKQALAFICRFTLAFAEELAARRSRKAIRRKLLRRIVRHR